MKKGGFKINIIFFFFYLSNFRTNSIKKKFKKKNMKIYNKKRKY